MRHGAALLLSACLLLAACGVLPPTVSPGGSGQPDAASDDPQAAASTTTVAEPSSSGAAPSFGLLDVGGVAVVVADEPLALRTAPGAGPESTLLDTTLAPGMRAGVVEGPATADGLAWYRLRLGDVEGWTAAGSVDGIPWLASIRNGLIAFGQEVSGQPQIFVVRLDGSRLVQLTNLVPGDPLLDPDVGSIPQPAPSPTCGVAINGLRWSPDGGRLAVAIGSCQPVVLTLGLDGAPHRVGVGTSPAWSPDGTQILYAPNHPAPPCALDCYAAGGALEIHLADAAASDGDGAPVTANGGTFAASSPDWSPDGTRIAFAAIDGAFVDQAGSPLAGLYVANADGGEQTRIATGSAPRWSPDGLHLAFTDAAGNLAVIAAEGGEPRIIGRGTGAAWSPGGGQIAFSVSDGAGTTTTHVSSVADGNGIADIPGQLQGWAPDGTELLLTVQRFGGGIELQRHTLETGAVETLLGTDTQSLTTAAWQPVVIRP